MRNVCRHTLVLVVVAALLLVPSFASAAVVITYDGETPSGITNSEGHMYDAIDEYPGGSADMWDYVYILDPDDVGAATNTGTEQDPVWEGGGPWNWGIACPGGVSSITSPDDDGGYQWIGVRDSYVASGEYGGVFSAFTGRAAVLWQWYQPVAGADYRAPTPGTFSFQSTVAPQLEPWVAVGGEADYSGDGDEWSASPEPASMALYGLSLLGVGWWRRRKKTA